jgi:hypothetical protein
MRSRRASNGIARPLNCGVEPVEKPGNEPASQLAGLFFDFVDTSSTPW